MIHTSLKSIKLHGVGGGLGSVPIVGIGFHSLGYDHINFLELMATSLCLKSLNPPIGTHIRLVMDNKKSLIQCEEQRLTVSSSQHSSETYRCLSSEERRVSVSNTLEQYSQGSSGSPVQKGSYPDGMITGQPVFPTIHSPGSSSRGGSLCDTVEQQKRLYL